MKIMQIFETEALTFSNPRRFLTQRRFTKPSGQTKVDGTIPSWGKKPDQSTH